MEVPNFPFQTPMQSYVPSAKIRKYLRDYVETFGLRELFRTSTNIDNVSFEQGWKQNRQWDGIKPGTY